MITDSGLYALVNFIGFVIVALIIAHAYIEANY